MARQSRRHRGDRTLIRTLGTLTVAAILAACTNGIETGSARRDTVDGVLPDCSPQPIELDALVGDPENLAATTASLAHAVFPVCADDLIIADATGLNSAAAEGVNRRAPVLFFDTEAVDVDAAAQTLLADIDHLDAHRLYWAGDETARADAELALDLVLTQLPAPSPEAADPLAATVSSDTTSVVIAGPGQRDHALATRSTLALGGYEIRLIETANPVDPTVVADLDGESVHYLAGIDPTDMWRIKLAITPNDVPGGGTEVFPDRRIVAFYGSPVTYRLGVLGEQGPQETVDRMLPIVESYRRENELIIPAFELIATVADSAPGDDGNYSQELDPEVLREWIDVATANDMFVIIDLQPGRTDFLTQAKMYEEYLRLPNVGLALDPEWRLRPDQVHLVQVGQVEAAEVNEVVDYLVDIVREEGLPQKVFVLHQFQVRMILDRDTVRTPEELAVVVHVDGQGPLNTKYGTYDTLTNYQGDDQTLWWGWKNFYDEDFPMATPEQVNVIDPLPYVITFQ